MLKIALCDSDITGLKRLEQMVDRYMAGEEHLLFCFGDSSGILSYLEGVFGLVDIVFVNLTLADADGMSTIQAISFRYLVGNPLGEGGFGITYISMDLQIEEICAIKEYMPKAGAARLEGSTAVTLRESRRELFENGKKRFVEEAGLLASFSRTPNIIHVYNLFEENGTAYYAMEYLDGGSLQACVNKAGGKLGVADGLPVMLQVMNGLETLHMRGVIHRDISPDNIYITKDGRVKILDFGSARFAGIQKSRNLSVIVKPGYAPPEQYGTAVEQGPWTDINALAATFYQVFTGRIPQESTERLLQDNVQPSSFCSSDISSVLNGVLMKALSLKAPERYQSIREMRDGLNGRTAEQGISAAAAYPAVPPSALAEAGAGKPSSAVPVVQTDTLFRKRIAAYFADTLLYALLAGGFIALVRVTVSQQGMLSEVSDPVTAGALILLSGLFTQLLSRVHRSTRRQGRNCWKFMSRVKMTRRSAFLPLSSAIWVKSFPALCLGPVF